MQMQHARFELKIYQQLSQKMHLQKCAAILVLKKLFLGQSSSSAHSVFKFHFN